jgi:hypothetical protein
MALGVLSDVQNATQNISYGTIGLAGWTGIDTGYTGTYNWIAIGI